MRTAIVGANGAIGNAIYEKIEAQSTCQTIVRLGRTTHSSDVDIPIDLNNEQSFAQAAETMAKDGPFDLVLVASGILHGDGISPEKSLKQIDPATMIHLFQVNTVLPTLALKHFLPLLRRDRRAVFGCLSARIGSISDNRVGGWHSYRASKAALNMVIKNAAIEAARTKPQTIIVGLHPGTVDSDLSRPFQTNLPAGQLQTPAKCADQLWHVINSLTSRDHGALIDYTGKHIAP